MQAVRPFFTTLNIPWELPAVCESLFQRWKMFGSSWLCFPSPADASARFMSGQAFGKTLYSTGNSLFRWWPGSAPLDISFLYVQQS